MIQIQIFVNLSIENLFLSRMNRIHDAHFKNRHCFRSYMFDSPTHDPISESHLVCGQHP